MKNAKIPQRKKASLSALAANTQNSDLMLSSTGVMSASQWSVAKEGMGYAAVGTSYDLAKEGMGYAMVDPACDIAKEAGSWSFA